MWDLISNSIYASILLSIAIGIIGSLIVINKASSITGSIAHGSFGGIGIGIYLGVNILLSTTIFTIILAIILAFITLKLPSRKDSLISVIWAIGMSVGILFLSLSNGYHADALSYLFGNILLIDKNDLIFMGIVDLILLISIILLYNRFLALSYDKEFLSLRKINTNLLYTYFLVLTSLTIVISVKSIGIILILALFTIPALIAEKFTKKFYQMIILSGFISLIIMISGILISYFTDLAPTPIIVIIASILLISFIF
ncbi:metal ABC transporter permease [Caminibacter mediatlanticus]|uniref:Zinc ABC transporter, permease protein n=1 Tax=Caminibacter mediatlanticus TB-2 TaxID=391592 RepID=A0AAI9AH91_9BACT|nr:metal ABC transporter permease [Caminibacter mediatlanticus]EDM23592.1 zinc ABC transporter, permease protein [Caminibacter mediatlanticus TB-2]